MNLSLLLRTSFGLQMLLTTSSFSIFRSHSMMLNRLSSKRLCTGGPVVVECKKYCPDEVDLTNLGAALAKITVKGDVITLSGDLGAGKTTLSRGFIREKCGDDRMLVTSPTYLLANKYEHEDQNGTSQSTSSTSFIHHLDLYRLPFNCDLSLLDVPSIFSSGVTLIEWPQRMSPGTLQTLPHRLDVQIRFADASTAVRGSGESSEGTAPQPRIVTLSAMSESWMNKLHRL